MSEYECTIKDLIDPSKEPQVFTTDNPKSCMFNAAMKVIESEGGAVNFTVKEDGKVLSAHSGMAVYSGDGVSQVKTMDGVSSEIKDPSWEPKPAPAATNTEPTPEPALN